MLYQVARTSRAMTWLTTVPMTSPEVAVLGTGPSGLAAAKALLEHGLQPVMFEAAANIGGMWEGPGRGAWSD